MRFEDCDRLAALHQQRFVVLQTFERADDRIECLPRTRRAAVSAVDDQIVRTFGHVGIEIVHQHTERGFLRPGLARELRPARSAYRSGGRSSFHKSVLPIAFSAAATSFPLRISSRAAAMSGAGARSSL